MSNDKQRNVKFNRPRTSQEKQDREQTEKLQSEQKEKSAVKRVENSPSQHRTTRCAFGRRRGQRTERRSRSSAVWPLGKRLAGTAGGFGESGVSGVCAGGGGGGVRGGT